MKYKIGFIGASKTGSNLVRLCQQYNNLIDLVGIYSNSKLALDETINIIDIPIATDMFQLIESSDIIFITTKDNDISKTWEYIQSTQTRKLEQIFIHCSGLLTSEVFINHESNGASLHPIFPFNRKDIPLDTLSQIQFSLEGGDTAITYIKPLLELLNLKYFVIDKTVKPIYHFICFILSSGVTALFSYATQISNNSNIDIFKLLPLSINAINNLTESNNITQSMTGPIARGDIDTLSNYTKLLEPSNLPPLKFIIEHLVPFTNHEHKQLLIKFLTTLEE